MSYIYKVKYNFDPVAGQFTKEQLKEKGDGGTDALLVVSMLYPPDGSFSMMPMTFDGRNEGKPLADLEIFKVWTLLGKQLSESVALDAARKFIAAETFESVRLLVLSQRGRG